jgi:hypothetical protein
MYLRICNTVFTGYWMNRHLFHVFMYIQRNVSATQEHSYVYTYIMNSRKLFYCIEVLYSLCGLYVRKVYYLKNFGTC